MSHNEKNSIGARIRQVRGDMSIKDFCDSLGVHRKTVPRWESDEVIPDGASLLALLERFGADPRWVLKGEGMSPNLSPEETALLDNYRHLPPEKRKTLEEVGRTFAQSNLKGGAKSA